MPRFEPKDRCIQDNQPMFTFLSDTSKQNTPTKLNASLSNINFPDKASINWHKHRQRNKLKSQQISNKSFNQIKYRKHSHKSPINKHKRHFNDNKRKFSYDEPDSVMKKRTICKECGVHNDVAQCLYDRSKLDTPYTIHNSKHRKQSRKDSNCRGSMTNKHKNKSLKSILKQEDIEYFNNNFLNSKFIEQFDINWSSPCTTSYSDETNLSVNEVYIHSTEFINEDTPVSKNSNSYIFPEEIEFESKFTSIDGINDEVKYRNSLLKRYKNKGIYKEEQCQTFSSIAKDLNDEELYQEEYDWIQSELHKHQMKHQADDLFML